MLNQNIFSINKQKLRLIAGLTILGLTIGIYITTKLNNNKVKNIRENVIKKIEFYELERKKRDIESYFKTMYESARTISLLPGVRKIEGGNRKSENEDVVLMKRFPLDAYMTVQQIYNNLASNISVSEVYAVIEGLDYSKGEVPFFMYDSLIVNENVKHHGEGENEVINPDYPKEDEEYEYQYYPKQINYFKQNYSRFNFSQLSDIPAVFSSVMRTCDNSQYISVSKGNIKDSEGILYSVPFYNMNNKLKGIISVIFRTNTIEASLLDIPFLIITEENRRKAAELNFAMPEIPSNFILYNDTYNILIYDRRNKDILQLFNEYLKNKDHNFISRQLNVKGDGKWVLSYYLSQTLFASELTAQKKMFSFELIFFILVIFILVSLAISSIISSQKRKQITNFAINIKDLAENTKNVGDALEIRLC